LHGTAPKTKSPPMILPARFATRQRVCLESILSMHPAASHARTRGGFKTCWAANLRQG
jgi:hypothetical protein